LTHWIAKLTEQQAGELMDDEEVAALEAEQALATAEQAAQYARIDVETLDEWIEAGLKTTEDEAFIKYNLDLFMDSQGEPSDQDKAKQVESIQELAMILRTMQKEMAQVAAGFESEDPVVQSAAAGLSSEEIENLSLSQIMELLKKQKQTK
jgi:hypothetical protein